EVAEATAKYVPSAPERGDAYEGPDDSLKAALEVVKACVDSEPPTEVELTEYREKFRKLGDDLSATGKLKSSKGLPTNRKLLVFLLSITKAADAKHISKSGWDNFFSRADAARANADVGLVGLTKM